ncbi:MAG TPA: APC family permease [Streptosporangiaceae bacterium]
MTRSSCHQPSSYQPSGPQHLSTARGAALYIGALLGPGLLLLPGLAAAQAGPASILAWAALLCLSGLFAGVFSALGRRLPSAGGVIGYVAAGLGARAGLVTGWWFLTAVVCGAPVVSLIGASYVAGVAGGGVVARAVVAAGLLVIVLALAAGGLRASTGGQLVFVSLLIGVVVAAAGSATSARAANWSPFAPHGWLSVGHAAATLMLSFVGWEAVAPLTTRFADPARQLPRVIGIALAATTALYLSLAIVTIGVLGPDAATAVPLADLLRRSIGPAGPAIAAVAAIVLTLGTTNAYVTGAAAMARELIRRPRAAGSPDAATFHGFPGDKPAQESRGIRGNHERSTSERNNARRGPQLGFLAAIASAGLLLITLYGAGLVTTTWLVAVPTTLFLAVYLAAMVAAVIVLRGSARTAAIPAALAVTGMLAYCGWLLAIPAVVALAVSLTSACGHALERDGHVPTQHVQPVGQDGAGLVGALEHRPAQPGQPAAVHEPMPDPRLAGRIAPDKFVPPDRARARGVLRRVEHDPLEDCRSLRLGNHACHSR